MLVWLDILNPHSQFKSLTKVQDNKRKLCRWHFQLTRAYYMGTSLQLKGIDLS